jgi:hypothetical protein
MEWWTTFVERYREELRAPAARDRLDDLARRSRSGRVTLVDGARGRAAQRHGRRPRGNRAASASPRAIRRASRRLSLSP